MLPIVHPVIGYLCYAVYTRATGSSPEWDAGVVAVGAAAVPDLIDKPLWLAGVVPVGRSLAHSLLVAGPVIVTIWMLTRRYGRPRLGIAFAIGYFSHLAADVPWHIVAGSYAELGFLLWPVISMPPYSGTKPLGAIGDLAVTTLWIEAVIFIGGLVVVWFDIRAGYNRHRSYGKRGRG